jgi:transitional endoplasmic reticulum ATPase
MDCHCKDHLPGQWHPHVDCDCKEHEYPTYSFVVTKVMEKDPGNGTAYVSKVFMENLELEEGDPVEILGRVSCVVQAREHPNPWVDTRMISLDKETLEKTGLQLFGQAKMRKIDCAKAESVILEVPPVAQVSRIEVRAMLEGAEGAVISDRDRITLATRRGREISFRIISYQPEGIVRLCKSTRFRLVGLQGEEYLSKGDTTFQDVGGLDEAIRKVREVVQLPLQHPEIFGRLGIDPPRGVLLHGPSGTGKTLIARAVAGETGCYFKSMSATEIMDKYYGESEAKLRSAFEEACKNAPAILFIDEIDVLAPRRDTTEGDVERRVTAQLLALMDGMEDRGNVIVLAATNMPSVLDPALRRPGRFDREILVSVPDVAGRKEILKIHTRDMPLGDVDFNDLADKTHGFAGADIKALCQEAAYRSLRRILPGLENTEQTLSHDFLDAITVEREDFETALKDLRPSSGRGFEVDLSDCGWNRIAGYEGEIGFLKEMVLWPLHNSSLLSKAGVKPLGGLLLTGPSGVGKTLMARSLAKESGFNVVEIRGPELLSKYVGESERSVREIFRHVRQLAPTVLILDRIDSITPVGWSDSKVMERVVDQLVLEMSSGTGDKPVLVVGVAERAENLPPTLRASGSFAAEMKLRLPNVSDRLKQFERYLQNGRVGFSGDLASLAGNSEGLSGGDIKEACRRVILHRARKCIEENPCGLDDLIVYEQDVLKVLDRWTLTAGLDHDLSL